MCLLGPFEFHLALLLFAYTQGTEQHKFNDHPGGGYIFSLVGGDGTDFGSLAGGVGGGEEGAKELPVRIP
jgi:hypothetical protein